MKKICHHELRNIFRGLLANSACYSTASVFDPLSARMAADLGFEVGILGGSVASLQVLGAPDIALITLSEFAEQASRIGRAASIPVIADADHGYGNALNVMRTVVELERAGVAALTLEDSLLPTQFGSKSLDLIEVEEGAGKIQAARQARTDNSLAIIARTHAGVQSLEEVIHRIHAYQDAGADAICLVGLKDHNRLAELGVRICVNGHAPYFAAIKATYDSFREQRGVLPSNSLNATQLGARYADLDRYMALAGEYMNASGVV